MKFRTRTAAIIAAALMALLAITVVSANNQWKNYKWDEPAPVDLTIGDNLTGPVWSGHLVNVVGDWGVNGQWDEETGPMLELTIDPIGQADQTNQNCTPDPARIEICNDDYGNTGWLGIAGVWVAKGKNITRAYTKMNDFYFDTQSSPLGTYNTPEWRRMVLCQEIGHDFGLSHQDEIFSNANLGSCMDYTNDPDGTLSDPDQLSNVHPNEHDYQQLTDMYGPDDGGKKGGGKPDKDNGGGPPDGKGPNRFAPLAAGEWGRAIGQDASGRDNEFEQDLGNGNKLVTHVLWAN